MDRSALVKLIKSQLNNSLIHSYTAEDLKCDLSGLKDTALHLACQYGNIAIVKAIIAQLGDQAAEIAALPNKRGWTPLHIAAKYNAEAVPAIITALGKEKAAEIATLTDTDDWTPLHLAARYNAETVPTIIATLGKEKATEIAALPNNHGWTPLHLAARYNAEAVPEIITALGKEKATEIAALAATDDWTPLHMAAKYNAETVPEIIAALGKEKTAEIAALPNKQGWTPLHIAAKYNAEAVPAIITALGKEKAAEIATLPNKHDHDWTPLHLAARYNAKAVPAIIAALGKEKAAETASLPNTDNWTPLHLAAKYNAEAVPTIIAVLGIDTETQLTKSCPLEPNEKTIVRKQIIPTVKDKLFPKLIEKAKLTTKQQQLCVRYEYILKKELLSKYGNDIRILIDAIDEETSLGKIFSDTTPQAKQGFFKLDKSKTADIEKQINKLLRANKTDLNANNFYSVPNPTNCDHVSYYHKNDKGVDIEVELLKSTKNTGNYLFQFPQNDPQKRHFMKFNSEHKLTVTQLRVNKETEQLKEYPDDEDTAAKECEIYRKEIDGLILPSLKNL